MRVGKIYSFDQFSLVTTYLIAVVLTIVGVMVGLAATITNGFRHTSSFSSITAATCVHRLDHLTLGQSLGASYANFRLGRTRLMLRLLPASETSEQVYHEWALDLLMK